MMTRQASDVDRKTRRLADFMAVDSDREVSRLLRLPITGRTGTLRSLGTRRRD